MSLICPADITMTHTILKDSPLEWSLSIPSLQGYKNRSLREVGLWRSTHLVVTQDRLLSINPFNKPLLIKLDLLAFLFGLMAPSAFGGHFAYTFLSWNKGNSYIYLYAHIHTH